MEPERDNLVDVLQSLESQIKKQTSLKFAFLKGLIYGLGTVVGATVLISILSYFFLQFFGLSLSEILPSETF